MLGYTVDITRQSINQSIDQLNFYIAR